MVSQNEKFCKIIEQNIVMEGIDPEILLIEITRSCNLRCVHCFNESSDAISNFSCDSIIAACKTLDNYGIKQIILSGGEPVIHPDFIKIIEEIMNNCEIPIKVLTNGTLLTPYIVDFLIKNSISLQITLNGHNELIDGAMRNSAFEKTVKNIKKIIERGGKELLTVNYSISKLNLLYIVDFIEFCRKLGLLNVQFSFVQNIGRARDNWEQLKISKTDMIKVLNEITELKMIYSDVVISFSGIDQFISSIISSRVISCKKLCEEIEINNQGIVSLCPKLSTYCSCNGFENNVNLDDVAKIIRLPFVANNDCILCNKYHRCVISCLIQKI
jgi:Predicted Fe-S oxidoreductases